MTRGIDLAVKHVDAAGGPNITVSYKDHKSGDPQAGVTRHHRARRGEACRPSWRPTSTTSGPCSPGPSSTRSSPSTAVAAPAASARACPTSGAPAPSRPTTPCPACSCTSRRRPPTPRPSASPAGTSASRATPSIKEDILKKIADAGYEFNGLYELFPPNTTDYAAILTKIKANEPDILLAGMLRAGPRASSSTRRRRPICRRHLRVRVHPRRRQCFQGRLRQRRLDLRLRLLRRQEPDQPAGQAVRVGVPAGVRRGPRLLRRQLLRERPRAVGGHPPGAGQGRRHQRRRRPRCRPPGEPDRRERVRRLRHRGRAPTRSTRRPTPW